MLEFTISDPTKDSKASAPLRVTWYTDPHNVWCWGFEPMMRRIEILYPSSVDVEIRMGGLFEDFSPVREQWARMSGGRWAESVRAFFDAVAAHHRMPMSAERMLEAADDFNSTWPACIAAKAAELQGRDPGRRYLRALREAWCLDGRGIHRTSVQTEVAREAGLDVDAFAKALDDGRAEDAFREDRRACERLEVTGFPTFEIQRGDASARINGWQPWDVFEDVMRQVDPGLVAKTVEPTEASVVDLLRRYARCATREVAAILGIPDDDAEILLEELEGTGRIERTVVGRGLVWQLAR
jgi:predicted DsbA family dithiol-disulfide isomerase